MNIGREGGRGGGSYSRGVSKMRCFTQESFVSIGVTEKTPRPYRVCRFLRKTPPPKMREIALCPSTNLSISELWHCLVVNQSLLRLLCTNIGDWDPGLYTTSVFVFGETQRSGDFRKQKRISTQEKSDFAIALRFSKRKYQSCAQT